jgi:predicted metal-dependent hydrolase
MGLRLTDTSIQLGEVSIKVTRKDIKNVHLSVHPPDGHVTLAAPQATRLEVARAYAISKLGWLRDQQQKLASQRPANSSPGRATTSGGGATFSRWRSGQPSPASPWITNA